MRLRERGRLAPREENRRKDEIIMSQALTVLQLTVPREPSGATEPPIKTEPLEPAEPADPRRSKPEREDPEREQPEEVDPERPEREEPQRPEREAPGRVEPAPSEPIRAPQETAQPPSTDRRSWWRRMFGG